MADDSSQESPSYGLLTPADIPIHLVDPHGDVIIRALEGTSETSKAVLIRASSRVLCDKSPYFTTLLEGSFVESLENLPAENPRVLKEVNPNRLCQLLRILHGNMDKNIIVSSEDVLAIVKLAGRYLCTESIKSWIPQALKPTLLSVAQTKLSLSMRRRQLDSLVVAKKQLMEIMVSAFECEDLSSARLCASIWLTRLRQLRLPALWTYPELDIETGGLDLSGLERSFEDQARWLQNLVKERLERLAQFFTTPDDNEGVECIPPKVVCLFQRSKRQTI